WFSEEELESWRLGLDWFSSAFTIDGQARDFQAGVTLTRPNGEVRESIIRVNHPMSVGSGRIYLSGNGFAPALTVTDADGEIAFSGPVPFLPQDGTYISTGVVSVPDAN